MEDIDDSDVPEAGAVFTYGLSRFGDNEPGKFWVRNDKAVRIACGEEHTVVLVESGRAFSFGKNDWGQLGIGNSLSLQTKPACIKAFKSLGEKTRLVACGRNHTIISTESGSLYGMGGNGDRQLGVETEEETILSPLLIQRDKDFLMLSAGGEMSAVLLRSGELFTFGANAEGQCGIGSDVDSVSAPTRVRLPGKVKCVSCGYYHTAAVLNDGRLFAWGEAEGGKLGLGSNVNDSQLAPLEVEVPARMAWVSCGNNHTVAVSANGRLFTWGEGPSGQLGLGENEDSACEPRQVKFKDPNVRIKMAEAGDSHTIAVAEDGRVFAFGDARHGKLGLLAPDLDLPNVWRPQEIARFPDSGLAVTGVSCGGCHTVLLGEWREPETEAIVPASVAKAESTPQPLTRRRRDRAANGDEQLARPLPPLRRSSTREERRSDEGFGSQASSQNGEKSVADVSDSDDGRSKGKSSFDNMLLSSKFDNMLSLDDEEEKVVPPPRKSLRGKKESNTSTSAYAVNDLYGKNSSPIFGKKPSLRREEDSEEEEKDRGRTRSNVRRQDTEEEEMEKESTRGRKSGRGRGIFSKRSALHDDDDEEEEEDDESPPPLNRSRPNDKTSNVESGGADQSRAPIFRGDMNESVPDTKKVRVGCGGGRSEDESKKVLTAVDVRCCMMPCASIIVSTPSHSCSSMVGDPRASSDRSFYGIDVEIPSLDISVAVNYRSSRSFG